MNVNKIVIGLILVGVLSAGLNIFESVMSEAISNKTETLMYQLLND